MYAQWEDEIKLNICEPVSSSYVVNDAYKMCLLKAANNQQS